MGPLGASWSENLKSMTPHANSVCPGSQDAQNGRPGRPSRPDRLPRPPGRLPRPPGRLHRPSGRPSKTPRPAPPGRPDRFPRLPGCPDRPPGRPNRLLRPPQPLEQLPGMPLSTKQCACRQNLPPVGIALVDKTPSCGHVKRAQTGLPGSQAAQIGPQAAHTGLSSRSSGWNGLQDCSCR